MTGLEPPAQKDPSLSDLPLHHDSAIVGASGAVISAGKAEVVIPQGALAEPVEIIVQPVESGFEAFPEMEDEAILQFLPHGTQFLKPVTILVPHQHELSDDLVLYTSEPNEPWTTVPGATFTAEAARADVMHFSFFFTSPRPPAPSVDGAGGSSGTGGSSGSGGSSGVGGAGSAGASSTPEPNGGSGGTTGGASGDPGPGSAGSGAGGDPNTGGSGGGSGEPSANLDYRDIGEWHGNLFAVADETSSVARDGMCATGVVNSHPQSQTFALWGWNLNQEDDGVVGMWTPVVDTLRYQVSSDQALLLSIRDQNGQDWCYPLPADQGEVSLLQFNSKCWDNSGAYYDGQIPLESINLVLTGSPAASRDFHFCVDVLEPVIGDSDPGGAGGSSGAGGAAGGPGSAGSAGDPGAGGAGGAPGTGGAGEGGAAGEAGQGGAAGEAGQGGAAGEAGQGGAAGEAGQGGAAGEAGEGGAAGGGAAGGTGEGGGTGEDPPPTASIDYLHRGEWHGSLFALADEASSVERDGMCAEGTVASHPESQGFALWGWNLNQEDEGPAGTWLPTDELLHYDVDSTEPVRLSVRDANGKDWCVPLSDPRGEVSLFELNERCWDDSGEFYDGEIPLVSVAVVVPGNDSSDVDFQLCVNELNPGPAAEEPPPPPSDIDYRDIGEWHGSLYSGSDESSTVERQGMCAEGTVSSHPQWASFGLWGWNLNQDEQGNLSSWQPSSELVYYDIASSVPVRLSVRDENGKDWCIPLTQPSGEVDLLEFNAACWDNSGDFYDGQTPLVSINVVVPGNDSSDVDFHLCVDELAPAGG